MTISLRHARVRYGPLEALHGITLGAPTHGLTVLLGRNGSGRTTALRALAGTVALSGGAVVWDGADVTRMPAYERARRGLCLVPERQAVFGSLTVRENLELAAHDYAVALDAYPQLSPLLPRRAAPSPEASSGCSPSPGPFWHARAWCSSTNRRRACRPRSRHTRTNCWAGWTRVWWWPSSGCRRCCAAGRRSCTNCGAGRSCSAVTRPSWVTGAPRPVGGPGGGGSGAARLRGRPPQRPFGSGFVRLRGRAAGRGRSDRGRRR